MPVFVHIAGSRSGRLQCCSRCGLVLVDRSEALSAVMARGKFFRVGSFVASDGMGLVDQASDAFGGQERCEGLAVDVVERKMR